MNENRGRAIQIPDAQQLRAEADRIVAQDTAANPFGYDLTPRDALIEFQPEAPYCVPFWVKNAANAQLADELQILLSRLRQVNLDHEGENALEVQAYYTVSGFVIDLEEDFRRWADAYIRLRIERKKADARLRNDPFIIFDRLISEYDQFLGALGRRKGSINYVFMNQALEFAGWLLWDILRIGLSVDYLPVDMKAFSFTSKMLHSKNWHVKEGVSYCCNHLKKHVSAADQTRLKSLSDEDLKVGLRLMAEDIQEMRPLLLGYQPFEIAITRGRWHAGWSWSSAAGIAAVFFETSPEALRRSSESRQVMRSVAINHNGLLCDRWKDWLTVEDAQCYGTHPLALNYLLLEEFHRKIFSLFEPVYEEEWLRIQEALTLHSDDVVSEATVESALAVSCRDLAAASPSESPPVAEEDADQPPDGRVDDATVGPAPAKSSRDLAVTATDLPVVNKTGRRGTHLLRPLTSDRLFAFLREKFRCETRAGKGSEQTVYRPGGKIFTLGHHRQRVTVHPSMLRRVLKRLEITIREWLAAVYGA